MQLKDTKPMLTLLYGGAFDPVHLGHLAVARAARDQLNARLFLVPTGEPPHRDVAKATAEQRLAMLTLSLTDEPQLHIDKRELLRTGRSYTVDTLTEWREELGPDQPLGMIVGDDAFAGLTTWHRWQDLFELAHVVVANRPSPSALPALLQDFIAGRETIIPADLHTTPAGCVYHLHFPLYEQASSTIRARCAQGGSLQGWVIPAVADYIQAQNLYR